MMNDRLLSAPGRRDLNTKEKTKEKINSSNNGFSSAQTRPTAEPRKRSRSATFVRLNSRRRSWRPKPRTVRGCNAGSDNVIQCGFLETEIGNGTRLSPKGWYGSALVGMRRSALSHWRPGRTHNEPCERAEA